MYISNNLEQINEVGNDSVEDRRIISEERAHRPNIHKEGKNPGKRADSRESGAMRASITREVTTSKPIH